MQDTDKGQQGRQCYQKEADAIDAQAVVDADRGYPGHFLVKEKRAIGAVPMMVDASVMLPSA